MGRYLLKIAAFLLALAAPFALLLAAVFGSPDALGASLPYTLHYKIDLLQNTPGQRIIFAGGSASEYGIICEDVAAATGRPAICIGVTAYLGPEIYLDLLETYARAGDTVVLMMENMLFRENITSYLLLWQAIGSDPDAWAAVPVREWLPLLMTAKEYYDSKIPAGWSLFKDGWQPASYDFASEAEAHNAGFGPWGDIVAARPESQLEQGYNAEDLITLEPALVSGDTLQRVQRFVQTMQARGVQVMFAHAPLDALCLRSTEQQNAAYAATVEQGIGVPVLVRLEEAVMEAVYFYNTNNHLTDAGARIYTQLLLERLLPLLE